MGEPTWSCAALPRARQPGLALDDVERAGDDDGGADQRVVVGTLPKIAYPKNPAHSSEVY
jgi:hypothetical protein